MSKRPARSAKRKKSSYKDDDVSSDEGGHLNQLLANLDLGDKSTTPKVVAKALLSLIPEEATKQHKHAKILAKAFPLVMAELDARSNMLAKQSHNVGARQPIQFRFAGNDDKDVTDGSEEGITATINVPEECFVHIMQYLDGKEIVSASRVSKVWLSASRLPIVWEDGFDMSRMNCDKRLNMTSLLALLGRPQFANLKALALPYKVKLGKNSVKQLAKALPHLETLDVGYYSFNAKANDSDLIAATEHFPNLTSLRTDMWNVTSFGISSAVRALGEQLIDLRIEANTITKHYPSSGTMDAIITSCPNLKYFAYRTSSCHTYYEKVLDGVAGDDIVRLVQECRRLETLELHRAMHVKQEDFINIANIAANDLNTFALRKLIAVGYHDNREDDSGFDICSLLKEYTFLEVDDEFKQARLGRGIICLSKRRRFGETL